MYDPITCSLCGHPHHMPGPFYLGTATAAPRGGWWCRDGRACRARLQLGVSVRSITCHPDLVEALRSYVKPEPGLSLPPALLGGAVELRPHADMPRERAMLTYADGSTAWLDLATGATSERTPALELRVVTEPPQRV
ncbi:MAG: hypothetical protein ACRCZP_04350 [Phycicoccus sp.]